MNQLGKNLIKRSNNKKIKFEKKNDLIFISPQFSRGPI